MGENTSVFIISHEELNDNEHNLSVCFTLPKVLRSLEKRDTKNFSSFVLRFQSFSSKGTRVCYLTTTKNIPLEHTSLHLHCMLYIAYIPENSTVGKVCWWRLGETAASDLSYILYFALSSLCKTCFTLTRWICARGITVGIWHQCKCSGACHSGLCAWTFD